MSSQKNRKDDRICPACDEDILEVITCKNCTEEFLICEECETIFKDHESTTDPEYESPSLECPHCRYSI